VRYDGNARLLAGGQSLVPLINFRLARPDALIDLGRCPGLSELYRNGDSLICGPMLRQIDVERSALVAACCPLIARTMPFLGPPATRNRGTIGGTLAHADRIAELSGVAIALEAGLVAKGPNGTRTIAAQDFFLSDLTTAMAPDEMLREIHFPVSAHHSRSAFVEMTNRRHDLALVGIAVYLEFAVGETCTKARVVAIGVGPTPVRLTSAERALVGSRVELGAITEASAASASDVEPEDDLHASAEYRKRVMPHIIARTLRQAVGRM
jgi:CO/xanthine dehydrogenase FAD-binding subunit